MTMEGNEQYDKKVVSLVAGTVYALVTGAALWTVMENHDAMTGERANELAAYVSHVDGKPGLSRVDIADFASRAGLDSVETAHALRDTLLDFKKYFDNDHRVTPIECGMTKGMDALIAYRRK